VVVAESPPLFLAAAGVPYARLRGARLVLHVADLWPDSAIQLGALRSPGAIRAARWLERQAYLRAAAIVVPTQGMADEVARRPEAAGKVRLMLPSVELDRFYAPPLRRAGPLRVLYAGTVGMAQGLDTLVRAAQLAGPDTVRVTIAGDGAELASVRELARAVPNVDVIGAVDAAAVPGLYAAADVAAVLLRDLPLFQAALPSKMFEALAAGRPVVLCAKGEAADLVRESGVGVVVEPEDAHTLAAALKSLHRLPESELARLGGSGRAVAERFDRPGLIDRWHGMLEELSGR